MRRVLNQMGNWAPWRRKSSRARTGTARKKTFGLLGVLFSLYVFGILLMFFGSSVGALLEHCSTGSRQLGGLTFRVDSGGLPALCLYVPLVLVSCLLLDLVSPQTARADWAIEWLITLPIPRRALAAGQMLSRVTSLAVFLWLLPCFLALAWWAGHGWNCLWLGPLAALPMVLFYATLVVIGESWMRLGLSPARLRTLQGVLSLCLSMLVLLPGLPSMCRERGRDCWLFLWGRGLPQELIHLPIAYPVLSLTVREPGTALAYWLASLGLALLGLGTGVLVVERWLASGVVSGGSRETGRSGIHQRGWRPRWCGPLPWREFTLLARDRNLLVQTLLTPLVVAGCQMLVNPRILQSALRGLNHLAALAFALACYQLLSSVYQSVSREGQAWWLLCTLPWPLPRLLAVKALWWSLLALVYALVVFGVGLIMQPQVAAGQAVWTVGLLVTGVLLHALIALCLGVSGCDPLAEQPQHRLRLGHLYLFVGLVSLYTAAFYAPSAWQQVQMVFVSSLLCLALWQKMVDKLPYLLDPTPLTGLPLSLADGFIAAQAFFVLQVVFWLLWRAQLSDGLALPAAFGAAGLVTCVAAQWTLRRNGTRELPVWYSASAAPSALAGTLVGLLCAGIAKLYLSLLQLTPTADWAALGAVLLGLLAAPFEEYIFRGLIFGGLRRVCSLPQAVLLSATIFAMLHPPTAVVPVFLLGAANARLVARYRVLWPAIVAHAVYNCIVIGW